MKNLFLSILALFFLSQNAFSQNIKLIDSLITVFETSTINAEKVKATQTLFHKFKHENPEKAYEYALKGLELSKTNNNKKGEGLGYLNLAYYYRYLPNNDSSRFYFEKSVKTLNSEDNLKNKLWLSLNEYAIFETIQGNFEKALKLADEGIKVAIEIKHGPHIVDNIQRKSTIYMDMGNFKLAMEEALNAIKVLDTTKPENKVGRAIALADIGRIDMLRGNYEQAVKPLEKSLKLFKLLDRDYWIATMYMEVGNVHWYLKDYDKSLVNYEESLAYGIKMYRDDFIATNYSNMADIFSRKGNHNKALDLLNKAQEITKKIEFWFQNLMWGNVRQIQIKACGQAY